VSPAALPCVAKHGRLIRPLSLTLSRCRSNPAFLGPPGPAPAVHALAPSYPTPPARPGHHADQQQRLVRRRGAPRLPAPGFRGRSGRQRCRNALVGNLHLPAVRPLPHPAHRAQAGRHAEVGTGGRCSLACAGAGVCVCGGGGSCMGAPAAREIKGRACAGANCWECFRMEGGGKGAAACQQGAYAWLRPISLPSTTHTHVHPPCTGALCAG
jgi:hypothetical protein